MRTPLSVSRLRRDEDGASLLEMTVVTPFLLALGLGVFEFGNVLYQYHLVTGGVRDAARFAAGVPAPDPVDPAETACDENDPRATPVGCAKRLAVTGQLAAGGSNRVDWWQVDDITITYPTFANADLGGGLKSYRGVGDITVVQVTTQFEYADLGFLDYFGLGPLNITTAHEERHYGDR
jgi:hypothetical protein